MRYFIINLLLIILLICSIANAEEFKYPIPEKVILDNGLTILLIENDHLPIIDITMLFKTGSIYDPEGKEGLANFTASMLTQGTNSRSAQQLAEEIEFIGAFLDSYSYVDNSKLNLKMLSNNIDLGLDILLDIILNVAFDKEEIERQRQSIIANIQRMQANPITIVDIKADELAFKGHPYGHPRIGYEESISTITREDLINFYQTYYVPNNTIMVLSGDFDSKKMAKTLSKKFGVWKQKDLELPSLPETKQPNKRNIYIIDRPLTQAIVEMLYPSIHIKHPDFYKILLINYILGGGNFSSRLVSRIRVNEGLAYDVYSDIYMYRDFGAYYFAVQTRTEMTAKAMKGIFEEMDRLCVELINDEELQNAKNYFIGILPMTFQSNKAIAEQYLHIEFNGLDENYLNDYKENMLAITSSDLLETAKTYLDSENIIIVIAGKAEEIKPQVEDLGIVEILEE